MDDHNLTSPRLANLSGDAKDDACTEIGRAIGVDDFIYISVEICILVVLSHLLHILLKRYSMPSVVSQMLAGLLVGRTCLGRIPSFKRLYKIDDDDHLTSMATIGGTFFMFLVGLEIDFQTLQRSIRAASFITLGCMGLSAPVAAILGPILYGPLGISGGKVLFVFTLIIILSNSASPVLIRMMYELKVTMSEIGRIGVAAALVNDVTCLLIIAVVVLFPKPSSSGSVGQKFWHGTQALLMIVSCSWVLRLGAQFVNRMNKKRQVIQEEVLWVLLLMLVAVTTHTENLGYPSMMVAFIMGLGLPRVGPTTRMIIKYLTFFVNNIILPIYFGYAGVQTDLLMLSKGRVLLTVVSIFILGTIGKLGSALAAAKYLQMQWKEGLVLGFLLNVKGHVELIVVSLGLTYGIWEKDVYQGLLIGMLFSSVTAGPAAAYIVRCEQEAAKYQSVGFQWLDLDKELRLMACIHSPYDISTVFDFIQISRGLDNAPLSPCLMHLIEFTPSANTSKLYNLIKENHKETDEDNQNACQVNAAVDAFIVETGVKLRQFTIITRFPSMHEPVCNGAKDIRAAMIMIPYHRKQRFDGKMGAGKDGLREFNRNVLVNAPCTVGILVDRGLGGGGGGDFGSSPSSGCMSDEHVLCNVAVLFLGGPDDREAVAYGTRLAMNPCVTVTVMRFVAAPKKGRRFSKTQSSTSNGSFPNGEMWMDMDGAGESDEEFIIGFQNRFVTTGRVAYMERVVEDSAEMVSMVASMEGTYSLFIVGRRRQGPTAQLTSGMNQCEEVGVMGDLLACSGVLLNGSVLVLQQHDAASKENNVSLMIDPQKEYDEDDHEYNEFSV